MIGINGKKIKKTTTIMYNRDEEETTLIGFAVTVMIREEYTDGTFEEVWGYIDDPEDDI